jgi:pyridoxal phosphate enzyme (YggS family)
MSGLAIRLERIRAKLNSEVQLIAVSKTRSIEEISELYNLGQRDFGENKIQELINKSEQLSHLDIKWHFIGNLQKNKINLLLKVKNLVSIHSVSSLDLYKKLITKEVESPVSLFLQMNTSGEVQKGGFDEVDPNILNIKNNSNLKIQGLMTIGAIRTDEFEVAARSSFLQLKNLKTQLDESYNLDLKLSMGMSQDYEIAMEYGTNYIRIGTELFGGAVLSA